MSSFHNLTNGTFQHVDMSQYEKIFPDEKDIYEEQVKIFFDKIPEKYLSMLAASRTYLVLFYRAKLKSDKNNKFAIIVPFDPPILFNTSLSKEELTELRKRELQKFLSKVKAP